MPVSGWILDAYPVAEGMCVWLLDKDGRAAPVVDGWSPGFYLGLEPRHQDALSQWLRGGPGGTVAVVERRDFFSGRLRPVFDIRINNPLAYAGAVDRALRIPGGSLYNADIDLVQYYFYERGLFPLAYASAATGEDGRVREWALLDSPWTLDYALPPMRYARLGFEFPSGLGPNAEVDPNHYRRGRYQLSLGREWGDGATYVFEAGEDDLVAGLNRRLADWDPDVVLSDWGDSYLMPRLRLHSERTGVPLRLSRDPQKAMESAPDRQFFSYGKMIYRAGTRTLFGRLHIDTRNSFMVSHTGLDGLYEIARVSKIPLQRAARCTIGTALSSMQHNWAVREGYLIPLDKGQTEDFRSGEDFLSADRGGLVYEPETGWHENVIEFDFVSMYPEIMVRHNVTPEAINCSCCPDNRVPEIGHRICRNRRGMVPAVLEPIVKKRAAYKSLVRSRHPQGPVFKRRADAFKWALVTCFGYLGFRNARFGKIEAHECVNAYSREALLKAKEIAEGRGFHFVHAIVDSLWLKKDGVTAEETEALRKAIEQETGLPLGLEGVYRWIRFCSSKEDARVGVPNRYFGVFETGEIKVRGLEVRRHDTPLFIAELQNRLLAAMARARTLAELHGMRQEIGDIVDDFRDRLASGRVTPFELAIRLRLTREPGEYRNDTLSALAAKKLAASGVALHEGESIQFVVAEEHDKVKDWRVVPLAFIEDTFEYDRRYYNRLIDRAIDITPFFPLSSARRKIRQPNTHAVQLVFPDLA